MILRPYQHQAINNIAQAFNEGHKRVLLMLATGAGKTATAAELIRQMFDAGGQSLFVVSSIELVGQSVRHLEHLGLRVGVLQGESTDWSPNDDCIVATIQTIKARGLPIHPGLIIVDEAHILHSAHIDLLAERNLVPAVGLSATPLRPGLGNIFTKLVTGPSIRQLIDQGHLAPLDVYGPATAAVNNALRKVKLSGGDFVERQLGAAMRNKELIGDIVETWQRRASDKPTLVFATDVAHSMAIVNDFLVVGVQAAHLDARTPESCAFMKERHPGWFLIMPEISPDTARLNCSSCIVFQTKRLSRAER